MDHRYTAKIYLGDKKTEMETGNDLEKLHIRMVSHVTGRSTTLHGVIIDNQTNEVIRRFRKTPID